MARRNRQKDQAPVDAGLELQFAGLPGHSYTVPAEVVAGLRQMLTRLLAGGQWPQAVALTSAQRREGVSYTALALSAVLSQDTASRVCLVDTNWHWPSALAAAPDTAAETSGLAGVIEGRLPLEQALVRVQDVNALSGALAWLPAGQMAPSRRVGAARGPELKAAMAGLRARFDYLVLDTPAVLATSDAIALAGLADAVCMVVHQGVTPAPAIQEALAAIGHLSVAGVILNHVRVHMPARLAGPLTAPIVNEAALVSSAG